MKTFVSETYGPPSNMQLRDAPKPTPRAGEVLIRVMAVSVNPADWHCLRGKPLFSRATLGFRRPKHPVLGVDVAGRVEAVGPGVTRFKAGDEVYANLLDRSFGGFAEYVATTEDVIARKPANLTFEEAAAVPMAAITALQGLRHHGPIRRGQTVLVNGASGGVGHFAVQIAKALGATVTGVTSTGNLDLVRSLGADRVVDYTKRDFAKDGPRHDLIVDTIGNRSRADLIAGLTEGGKAAVIGFTSMRGLLSAALFGGKRIKVVQAHATVADFEFLTTLIEAGKVRPAIDRSYPFTELPEAIAYLEKGRARGKVVVAVAAA
ncbi:MAG: NAD(P)-dependent alcohol dehydrogenase [Bauldia sp.]|nr:NAD(P)-dependent alcohol dehydrogenase [Bauldia sp.]